MTIGHFTKPSGPLSKLGLVRQRLAVSQGDAWILKGRAALEFRMPDRARATCTAAYGKAELATTLRAKRNGTRAPKGVIVGVPRCG